MTSTDNTKFEKVNVDRHIRVINLGSRMLGCRLLDANPVTVKKVDVLLRVFVMGGMSYVLIPGLMAMVEFINDLGYVAEIGSNVLGVVESVCFLGNSYYQESKCRNLVQKIHREFWASPLPPDLLKHVQWFERISIGIGLYVFTVSLLALTFYSSIPPIFHNFDLYEDIDAMRRTPLISKYFYDQRVSPNYEITYACQILGSFLTVTSYVILTSIYALICMHLCAKLRLLQVRLSNIDASISNEEFAEIVHEHQYLIRYADDLEDIYSPVILIHFILSTGLICLGVVKVTGLPVQAGMMELVLFIMYFAASFFQIFVFCWMANEVFVESDDLARATYDSRWYEGSRHVQRGILLILLRAQKPSVLTAGKFFPVTMSSFGLQYGYFLLHASNVNPVNC
ncbi:odorant receptor 49b-like isoform X1 [Neodiprion fabricii]|uniref:odorant receptor 49b-like isoform X1 n=1 Tax=Neodiprion fabricii TaxID=2872261 RepID=UPI001ED91BCA|nr:odorant receptor 49b-like isoform X1 [Neodiprion fabricii]